MSTITKKVALLAILFDHTQPKLSAALGISDEKDQEIRDFIDGFLSEEGEAPKKSEEIQKVIEHFDEPNELAYALVALLPEQSKATKERLQKMFGGMMEDAEAEKEESLVGSEAE